MALTRFLASIGVALLISAQNAFAVEGMGTIRVEVKDFYDSAPIAGAQVLITPCNDSGTTDSTGEYLYTSVTPYRNYQVEGRSLV